MLCPFCPCHTLKALWGLETLILIQGCLWWGGAAGQLMGWKTMGGVSGQRPGPRTPMDWGVPPPPTGTELSGSKFPREPGGRWLG